MEDHPTVRYAESASRKGERQELAGMGERRSAPADARADRARVAEINGCNYCLSAHAYLGKNLAKLDDAEITANRNGACSDPKADAAVRFAVKIVRERGHVSEDDLRAVKLAGFDDAQVIEILLHVTRNTWTNYINEVAKTDIDFPAVTARKAA
jgi:AhpD family alkylhydroperoxidase